MIKFRMWYARILLVLAATCLVSLAFGGMFLILPTVVAYYLGGIYFAVAFSDTGSCE